ncbi:TonB-dependent receptor [Polaribacter filamentus]|uniref:TonB-dependent receptor n=1 Tax=Polaribacter filamentus TaxID=53483 RepID=A0A2S7KKJ1_9FLAO|nr:TonB-dependent receptor [Polaribacter filamentus]PQB03120.1 TonB-dependent receptor [Polaribacter filamentus]
MKLNNILKNLMFSFLFLLSLTMAAQTIKGKVTDASGGTLPYMNVVQKGTTNGTVTDDNGEFTITVKSLPTKLVISSMGFMTKEITVTNTTYVTIVVSEDNALDEVVVIGSRNPNRTAIDSPVPIDIVDIKELIATSPQVNLNQILNFVAPSFTSNTQTISDGTDHVDPAALRGLGPDQVLVLINGKRRHTSSLVNVNGTFGRGSVGTDLNSIPAASIKRIEVLRDGAAAQYGSDAIAGVINIVLNETVNELLFNVTTGGHFSKNSNGQTGGVDGETINISANYGLPLGKNGGLINFTGDFDYREDYNRMKEWEGSIFNLYNTVERFANNDGYDLSKLLDNDVNDVIQYANSAGINLNGASTKADLRTILSGDNTSAELTARGLDRADFNMRVGQSQVRGGRFFVNLKLPLDDNGTELYSFAGLSSRTGNSAGFYRLPNQSRTYTPAYMNGFLPEINSTITDKSVSMGIKGIVGDAWNIDFSNTYGKNSFLYTIGNTFNASQQNASPATFDAGGFSFMQNTINLDINKFYEDTFQGLNVAFGSEYRLENYEIISGEESSYAQYTAAGEVIKLPTQSPSVDFFGSGRPGGSQVFPGFSPANELSRGRSSVAGYIDLDATLSDAFSATFATRFENYSDFGSTLNFKLAGIYKASENFRLRGSFNTGFRAPSLQQLNFNSTSTIFQDGIPVEVGTFSNDSRAAKLLGIPQLKEEKSRSFSTGFTAKLPESNITLSLDGFLINIDDRVVYTGQFKGPGTGTELDNLLSQANASAASFFANAIDTRSRGIDLVITHKADIGSGSRLTTDLAATLSKTEQVGAINSSEVLRNAGLESTYFSEDSRIFLEEAVPRTKINLTNNFTTGKFNIFLRNVYFGVVSEATNSVANQQDFASKIVTDLSFGYKASESLTMTIGANNLLDVYPDRAIQANRSDGRFDWSRRSQQFGIGGRFLFARVSLNLK